MNCQRLFFLSITLVLALILIGCSSNNNELNELKNQLQIQEIAINDLIFERDELEEEVIELKDQIKILELNSLQSNSLLITAIETVELLKDKNMNSLSSYIHPNKGVRFTPYSYVDLQEDLMFSSQQIINLLQSSQVYTWGAFDGTGDPIQKNFNDYFDRFVYDKDYSNPHIIGNNVEIGTGNSINNITQAYPNGQFVEFHFTGFDPQYGGMDWRSLRLVFEELNNTWHLVGIIHSEWTI